MNVGIFNIELKKPVTITVTASLIQGDELETYSFTISNDKFNLLSVIGAMKLADKAVSDANDVAVIDCKVSINVVDVDNNYGFKRVVTCKSAAIFLTTFKDYFVHTLIRQ